MPITRVSSLLRSLRLRWFMRVLEWGYGITIRNGSWWEPLIEEAALRSGERILILGGEGCSARAVLASHYSAVHFSTLQSGESKITGEPLNNLELLRGNQCCIDCRAATFDKVICSLVLHPLPNNSKLAVLKEMKRVLRHGGTLYLADFDQPLRPLESQALRGTAHLFGPETAKSHHDGTWLDLIKQAGFVSVRRVSTVSEIIGRVAIVRARRA